MKISWPAIGLLLGATCMVETAQAQSMTFSQEKWFYGGGLGLSFGDVTYVELSPLLGYRISDRLSVGGDLIYRYRNDDRYAFSVSTSDYGGGLFARYLVADPFFLQAEYEYLNYEILRSDSSTERKNANSLFAGGGVSKAINRNVSLFATVLYNLTYSSYDDPGPYSSPWVVRFGVAAGF